MPQKKKITWMPDPMWSDEQYRIARWCANNNIIISPMGSKDEGKYKIGIALYDHRNVQTDKFIYEKDQVWGKVSEYQKYYYDKYSKIKEGNSDSNGGS